MNDSGGSVYAFQADASIYSQVVSSVEEAVKVFGKIDVLINNAASAKDSSLERSTPENFDFTLRNVLYPVYYYSKAVSEYMIKAGRGKIINIGSVNGLHGREGSIAYSSAKAGIIGLTKTTAKELGKYSINCNVVAPGYIATDGQEKTSELIKKLVLSECYIKRLSGIRELDTASAYGDSEKIIGMFQSERHIQFRVDTKLPVKLGTSSYTTTKHNNNKTSL